MDKDIKLLLVGALISIITTIINFLGRLIYEAIKSNTGKVNIYKKVVYSKKSEIGGFEFYQEGSIFSIPLWIEVHNTKNKLEIIRNVSIYLYSNKKYVGKMIQVNKIELDKERRTFFYGVEGAYTFLVEPQTIKRYELQFLAQKIDVKNSFDEVRLVYFDSKDKKKEFLLMRIDNCWTTRKRVIDKDWIKLN